MRSFTQRETFILLTLVFAVSTLIWLWKASRNPIAEIAPNVITDLIFGVLLVAYMERLARREHRDQNVSRMRATALSVQRFHRLILSIMSTLVDDGIQTAKIAKAPTVTEVASRARRYNTHSSVKRNLEEGDTLPFLAFMMSHSGGYSNTKVFPARPAHTYLFENSTALAEHYKDCLSTDNGLLPNDVVNALTELNSHHVMLACRLMQSSGMKMRYWAEEDFEQICEHSSTLSKFFSTVLALDHLPTESALKNAMDESLRMENLRRTEGLEPS